MRGQMNMSKLHEVPTPLNAQENLLYGVNKRLEILIEQFGSLLEHIASKEGVAMESGESETVRKPRAKKVN
jgi:hypothetical protein